MGSFDRQTRLGGGRNNFKKRDFGGRSFGGSDNGRPSMHRAICSKCGKSCEVPFRPTGDKPVFCSECFETKRNTEGNSSRFENRNFDRPSFGEKEMFSAICDECGEQCEVPFKPTNGKPVYCRSCFESTSDRSGSRTDDRHARRDDSRSETRSENRGNGDNSKLMEQVSSINAKLDRLIKALETKVTSTPTAKDTKTTVSKEAKVETAVKKAKASTAKKETKESKPAKATKKAAAKKKVAKKK